MGTPRRNAERRPSSPVTLTKLVDGGSRLGWKDVLGVLLVIFLLGFTLSRLVVGSPRDLIPEVVPPSGGDSPPEASAPAAPVR